MEAWRTSCPRISVRDDEKQSGQALVANVLTQPGSDRLPESNLVSLG